MSATRDKSYEDAYTLLDGVWVPKSEVGEFGYTDGDEVEERIAAVVDGADDVSLFSPELRAAQTDWASRYHLSASRANLLRPLQSALQASTLEIGAGCGAITRYLGESAGRVVALEGSSRRARIVASRCRDLSNVQVVNDTFDRFQTGERFSAVTFVGVLEYARIYGQGEAPAARWLEKAHQLLADDGVLVIAIENQLGLKYFAGLPEDHLAQPMVGINDQYGDRTAATYGRLELQQLLQSAGFGSVEFALPFPDYKLPVSIVLPKGYDGSFDKFDAAALAQQTVSADAQLCYPPLFSLARAWGLIGRNGLLADLSNSFLVVARKGSQHAYFSQATPECLAYHYASERMPQFCKQNTFRVAGGEIEVERERLVPEAEEGSPTFFSVDIQSERYVRGSNYGERLEALLTRRDWTLDDLKDWLSGWQAALATALASKNVHLSRHLGEMLPGWTIDALPRNLIVGQDGEQRFIDLEWQSLGPVEYGYVLYRAVTVSLAPIAAVAMPAKPAWLNVAELTTALILASGLLVTPGDIERYLQMDGVLREEAFGQRETFSLATFNTFQLKTLPEIPELVAQWDTSVDHLSRHQQQLDAELQAASTMLNERSAHAEKLEKALAECASHTDKLGDALHERMAKVEQLENALNERAAHAEKLEKALAECASHTDKLGDALHERMAKVEQLENALNESVEQVNRLQLLKTDQGGELDDMKTRLRAANERANHLVAEVGRLTAVDESWRRTLDEIYGSKSWRLTSPLRKLRRFASLSRLRHATGRTVREAYLAMPVGPHARLAFKSIVFRSLRPFISRTESYITWERQLVQDAAPIPAASKEMSDEPVDGQRTRDVAQSEDKQSVYVPLDDKAADWSKLRARAIAFYLPQFHPIAENDEWWGRGFTEWTNVSKAAPQFAGHYQPHLPGELGFYDLRVVDVMRRQVELARHYGVQGFCFHYYWFAGKRLLERPLQQFLDSKDIDFPFCISWANENWTRRWDGLDQEVLIGQCYSPEDDNNFIVALEPLLRDPRYIRIDGRPLIIMYRPSILPDAAATLQRWREHCRRVGIGEIFIAMVQFDIEDPRAYGFDVAIEFPPHKLATKLVPINDQLQNVSAGYSGHVVEYADLIESARQYETSEFDMFRGVFPSWDNEARKPGRGYTFANSSPERYREWLDLAVDYSRRHPVAGESVVFINAWNEWAEGAHLEPDRRYGYAFLEQTREALLAASAPREKERKSIVIVSHDAHPHGAQYLALHMARVYGESFGFEVHVVLLGEGSLREEFSNSATLHDLAGIDPEGEEACNLALQLSALGVQHAIANTTVSGLFAKTLKNAGMRVVSLVHELPGVLRDNNLLTHASTLAASVDCVVFPADAVRTGFQSCVDIDISLAVIRPQGLYKLNRYTTPAERVEVRGALRKKLNIPAASKVVLCVGYADHRKGVDLFVAIGTRLMQQRDDVHFLWVGHFHTDMEPGIRDAIELAGFQDRFHFPGIDSDTDTYYAGADVYALTSREDPFPSVVMEALQVQLPVVGFAGAGGFTDLLEQGAGLVVPACDVEAFAEALRSLLIDPARAGAMGLHGRTLIESDYSFHTYLFDLLDLLGCPLPKVSVVVPNYNYARYLPERIRSIVKQDVPIYELVVLDDASTDDSVEVIERLAGEIGIPLRVISNADNSGSVFRQWAKGVDLARGEFVWIAEADDLSEPTFLSNLLGQMSDPQIVMAYCQSKQIDADGQVQADNYLDYTNDISTDKWLRSYRAHGAQEINDCLAIKNTVPNVSAVLFRRDELQAALDRDLELMCEFRIAGDWIAYLDLLEQGDIAYVPETLNLHRRHSASVTIGSDNRPHMLEVLRVQQLAKQRYEPSSEALRMAEDYAAKLYLHFDLSDADIVYLSEQLEQTSPAGALGTGRELDPKLTSPKAVPEAPSPLSSGAASK